MPVNRRRGKPEMHLWVNQHRRNQRLPRVTKDRGWEVFDEHERRCLDGSGGPALFSLRYSHPEVNEAISEQMARIQFGYSTTFTSDAIDALAEMIAEEAGPEL